MSTPSKLPRELQEVETDLQVALQQGGLEACQRLVSSLAVEDEAARVIINEADLSLIEIDEQIDAFPEIKAAAASRIKELIDLKASGQVAVARYAYAVYRLHQIESTI